VKIRIYLITIYWETSVIDFDLLLIINHSDFNDRALLLLHNKLLSYYAFKLIG